MAGRIGPSRINIPFRETSLAGAARPGRTFKRKCEALAKTGVENFFARFDFERVLGAPRCQVNTQRPTSFNSLRLRLLDGQMRADSKFPRFQLGVALGQTRTVCGIDQHVMVMTDRKETRAAIGIGMRHLD